MSKPAGVELRRWFTYLVILLIFVNIAAVGISVVINRAVQGVVADYQPFAIKAGEIEQDITSVQGDMYKYLYTGAGAKNPDLADEQLNKILADMDKVLVKINEVKGIAPGENEEKAMSEIGSRAEQYRNAIEGLSYAFGDTVNFNLLKELLHEANKSGEQVMDSAANLAKEATAEILSRNSRVAWLTSFAMYLFIGVMAASVIVLLALKHWWKLFQDVMLGI